MKSRVALQVFDIVDRSGRQIINHGDPVVLREESADGVLVLVGGTIPREDIPELKRIGVAEVYTPGAPIQDMIDFLNRAAPDRAA